MNKQNRMIHYIFALAGVALLVFFDQVTKLLAVANLKGKTPFVLLEDVFQLEYLENRGAAFGLFQNQKIIFLLSVAVISGAIIWCYMRVPMNRYFLPLRICGVMIMSGALGNFVDRVRLDYVVDFFYFKLIHFPVFNMADIYVTVGTILLALFILFYYKEEDFERMFHRRDGSGRAD